MEHQTLRSILPANSGKGGVGGRNNWDKAWPVMSSDGRDGSPSIKLGLGIGAGSGGPSRVFKSVFTPVQLHELNLQALIFKYIVAGLPVPFHLLLPIWKSVASHFGYVNGGIYNQFPSFIGFSYQGFDYRSMMDPEPGRCRRTDGKKWRCSRNVVPDQKYCERHMHRGRQRSRKLVEASEITSESDSSTVFNFSKTVSTLASSNTYNTKANHSTSVPLSLQLKTPSSDTSHCAPTTVVTTTSSICSISRSNCNVDINKALTTTPTAITCCTGNNGSKINAGVKKESIGLTATPTTNTSCTGNNGSKNNVGVKKDSIGLTATPTTITSFTGNNGSKSNVSVKKDSITTTTTINTTFGSDNNGNSNDCINIKDDFCDHINEKNINRSTNFGNNGISGAGSKSTGFGFSPRSVLQVAGCSNLCFSHRNASEPEPQRCRRMDGSNNPCFNHRNTEEPEPQRCRRTDGKKWRCSRDVVPDQKYCGRHMHRGAKKLVVDPHQVTVAAAPITGNAHPGPPLGIPKKADNHMNLNTNLSISIPQSPQPTINGEKSTTSSSSDATTISDEFISVSH